MLNSRPADSSSLSPYGPSVRALLHRVEDHDPATMRHLLGVAYIANAIVERINCSPQAGSSIVCAAVLHDVGKVHIARSVLYAPRSLTDAEWRMIKLHPETGAFMAAAAGESGVAKMVRGHHERLDGRGYPDGLKNAQIPLGSRVIAVADAYDVIVSGRPYRQPLSPAQAIERLVASANRHFDPELVEVVVGLPRDVLEYRAVAVEQPLRRRTQSPA